LFTAENGSVPGNVQGKIVSFTADGQAVTDIAVDRLVSAPRDISCTIHCDEHQTAGLFPPNHTEPAMTFLAILGEGGFLELAIVGDSAKLMLGLRPGDKVSVKW